GRWEGRSAIGREKGLAMRKLWEDEPAGFHGEFVRFQPSNPFPKPVQRPRPPTLIGGGAGPIMFRHVAEYGDGWAPIGARGMGKAVPDPKRAGEEAGRGPATLPVMPVWAIPGCGQLADSASRGA